MYLSRVEINPHLRATKLALNSPQRLHAMVAASFPSLLVDSDSGRHLWRLDKLGHSLYVLVVSSAQPDFTHLIEQIGWTASGQVWETKSYDSFLVRLQQGQEWQFRLRANPTHSVKRKEVSGEASGNRGILYACSTIDKQKEWLTAKAPKHGFSLNGFELVERDVSRFERQRRTVTLHMATFEGLLKVEDPILLREALSTGIGRAKAYGCGLLTLARPYASA
jgi:CRISPR system Cascade subunit CasE